MENDLYLNKKFKYRVHPAYRMLYMIFLSFIIIAFTLDKPANLFKNLYKIIVWPDLLITDYIELTNFAATLLNVALVGSSLVTVLHILKIIPNGATIMAVWLAAGFSFFGKNIYNIWAPVLGVSAYAMHKKESLLAHATTMITSTALAPIVTQMPLLGDFTFIGGMLIGNFAGFIFGFLLAPLSSATVRVHNGYSLYNVGFSAGLMAMVLVSILSSMNLKFQTASIWSTSSNFESALFLYSLSIVLIITGFVLYGPRESLIYLKNIFKHSGRAVSDYYVLYKESVYINMGLLGVATCTLCLIIGIDLNGPTIGGIFTIIGYGAFGKHLKNITPVLIGSILASLFNHQAMNTPSISLAILFSTGLAPIAGRFGVFWGIIAGFLHVNLALHISYLGNGLNLYNNGFACGFIALILVPIIEALRKEDENEVPNS